ncbi:MAG: hypothetical protein LBR38_00925 [Synergistaceae bacterium]|jgi:hypothetical protein|nr:hypothetical protein [Synergistaceae bacterium]
MELTDEQRAFLLGVAPRYIWWKTPDEAMLYPMRILAQIMNFGIWDDWCDMSERFSVPELADVLNKAEAGWFNPRSWNFWHRRLGDIWESAVLAMRKCEGSHLVQGR